MEYCFKSGWYTISLSYDNFYGIFNRLYTHHFPIKNIRFDKNIHNIEPFMSRSIIKSLGTNAIVISHRAAVSLSPALHSLWYVSYNLAILKPISIDKLSGALMPELFTVNGAFHDKNGK